MLYLTHWVALLLFVCDSSATYFCVRWLCCRYCIAKFCRMCLTGFHLFSAVVYSYRNTLHYALGFSWRWSSTSLTTFLCSSSLRLLKCGWHPSVSMLSLGWAEGTHLMEEDISLFFIAKSAFSMDTAVWILWVSTVGKRSRISITGNGSFFLVVGLSTDVHPMNRFLLLWLIPVY